MQSPRLKAATITAAGATRLWAMDRRVYTQIKRAATIANQELKEKLMSGVPMFRNFSNDLKMSLTDAMESAVFMTGEQIFAKGE